MKRIVICCIITVLIFASGVFTLIYTSSVTGNIARELRQLREDFLSGDTEAAKAAAQRAGDKWESFREMHFLTVDNGHALEITMTVKRIQSLLEKEDEEALTECEVTIELIEMYGDEQLPDFMNIL
ncbi:MAG TPA: hypothetical protein DDX91_00010 [Ruminococcaceae bacterium]|nr:hypothetical protein [Oscillospiraceae bacterium]